MKIYTLPVDSKLQPESQSFTYPKHNSNYGVEQDFIKYINKTSKLTTNMPDKADWHYLPVFWTRWHINHQYAKKGIKELQRLVNKSILNNKKTFTICQYDDGPVIDLRGVKVFLSSRKISKGEDIPLLSKNHKFPLIKPKKAYKASFIGRTSTHKIRKEMQKELNILPGVKIIDEDIGSKKYVKNILQSYIALCPRGYGGSSFRFYEAMQLGVAPMLIGDIDTRPFKKHIPWNDISFYASSTLEAKKIIKKTDKKLLKEMGKKARVVYENKLGYQKWCKYIIKELE